MKLVVEDVEGNKNWINPDQITHLKVDDRKRSMTIITLSCGTAIRTYMRIGDLVSVEPKDITLRWEK